MIAQRILAILSAILLVGSVAIATVGPPAAPLGQVLYLMDEGVVARLHLFVAGHMAEWTWSAMVVPFLLRPAWLIPASLGLVLAGVALSLSNRNQARRPHRRSQ